MKELSFLALDYGRTAKIEWEFRSNHTYETLHQLVQQQGPTATYQEQGKVTAVTLLSATYERKAIELTPKDLTLLQARVALLEAKTVTLSAQSTMDNYYD